MNENDHNSFEKGVVVIESSTTETNDSPSSERTSTGSSSTCTARILGTSRSPRTPARSRREIDPALEFLRDHPRAAELLEEAREILADPKRSHKLTRKIDWIIIPELTASYFLQYLGKMTLTYTSVMGLLTDLRLVGQQYTYANMLFYFGFIACQSFTLYLAQRFSRMSLYLSTNIVLWGVVIGCHAAVQNFAQLAALRTVLGVFESCVSPILVLIVSMWYRKEEQGRRVSWFVVANSTSMMCGGFVAYGISQIRIQFPIWRLFFLLAGLYTIFIGVLIGLCLPDSPLRSKRFTDAEKMAIVLRIKDNQSGMQNAVFKKDQAFEAVRDVRVWLVAFCAFLGAVPNGAFTVFCAMMVTSSELDFRIGLLLSTPAGFVGIIAVLLCGYLSDRWRDRSTVMLIAITPAMVAAGLFYWSSGSDGIVLNKASLFAASVMFGTITATLAVLLAWIASNIAGQTKKIVSSSIMMVGFCVGNIISIQYFSDDQAPGYVTGKILLCVCLALVYPVVWVLRLYNDKLNREKAQVLLDMPENDKWELRDHFSFADATDLRNPFFVYTH